MPCSTNPPPPATKMCCPHSFTLYRPRQGACFLQKIRRLQNCAQKSKMCLKFSFQSRQAGVFSKFQNMHNYVGTIILKKRALPRAFFFTTKKCIFFDKKHQQFYYKNIATKKCPKLDFVKKTKGGQAGDDTFLQTHNFGEIDCLQICATKKCLKSTLCFFSFF